jgi:integrase
LQDVRPVAVEKWLQGMTYAAATKAKLKGVFGTLFRHGMRHQWTTANPIALVRCSGKRVSEPDVLTATEIRALLEELPELVRTVTLLAAVTGLRRGELFGLKWEDIDFERKAIRIVRSLVDQISGEPKTEASRRPLPLSAQLDDSLTQWRSVSAFKGDADWVFASPASFGKKPYWPDMMLRRHILPAAKRRGIQKRIGWHTFRRTAATLLLASGAGIKATQELMRHASAEITLELYAQAVSSDKRQAQNALSELIAGAIVQEVPASVFA